MNLVRLILVTLGCFQPFFAHTQDRKISIEVADSTLYNSRYGTGSMKLPYLNVTEGKAWRFWYDKYIAASFIIDIMGSDSASCKAFITTYTYGDVRWNEQNKFNRVYYKTTSLSPNIAFQLFQAAARINVSKFARTDTVGNAIRSYVLNDALPYTLEYYDGSNLYFKAGLRPENRIQFEALINKTEEFINFEKLKNNFEKEVPFSYFGSHKWQYIQRKLTSKQIKQFDQYWQRNQIN